MKYLVCSLALLLFATFTNGQEVDLPKKIAVKTDRAPVATTLVELKPTTEKITWTVVPSDDVEIYREQDATTKSIKLRLVFYREGDFYLVVAAANGTIKQFASVITVGKAPPIPPNAYESALVLAWTKESDADKRLGTALANVYDTSSVLSDIADFKILDDYWKIIGTFENKAGTSAILPAIHAVIATERAKQITEAGTTALTPDLRTRLRAFTSQTSTILKKIIASGPIIPPDPIPPPLDAFTLSIVAAWKTESEADKAKVKQYQAFFIEMAASVKDDTELKTVGNLRVVMTESRKKLIGESLRKVAAIIGDDLNAKTPHVDSAVLDDATRQLYFTQFTKYAAALGYCK